MSEKIKSDESPGNTDADTHPSHHHVELYDLPNCPPVTPISTEQSYATADPRKGLRKLNSMSNIVKVQPAVETPPDNSGEQSDGKSRRKRKSKSKTSRRTHNNTQTVERIRAYVEETNQMFDRSPHRNFRFPGSGAHAAISPIEEMTEFHAKRLDLQLSEDDGYQMDELSRKRSKPRKVKKASSIRLGASPKIQPKAAVAPKKFSTSNSIGVESPSQPQVNTYAMAPIPMLTKVKPASARSFRYRETPGRIFSAKVTSFTNVTNLQHSVEEKAKPDDINVPTTQLCHTNGSLKPLRLIKHYSMSAPGPDPSPREVVRSKLATADVERQMAETEFTADETVKLSMGQFVAAIENEIEASDDEFWDAKETITGRTEDRKVSRKTTGGSAHKISAGQLLDRMTLKLQNVLGEMEDTGQNCSESNGQKMSDGNFENDISYPKKNTSPSIKTSKSTGYLLAMKAKDAPQVGSKCHSAKSTRRVISARRKSRGPTPAHDIPENDADADNTAADIAESPELKRTVPLLKENKTDIRTRIFSHVADESRSLNIAGSIDNRSPGQKVDPGTSNTLQIKSTICDAEESRIDLRIESMADMDSHSAGAPTLCNTLEPQGNARASGVEASRIDLRKSSSSTGDTKLEIKDPGDQPTKPEQNTNLVEDRPTGSANLNTGETTDKTNCDEIGDDSKENAQQDSQDAIVPDSAAQTKKRKESKGTSVVSEEVSFIIKERLKSLSRDYRRRTKNIKDNYVNQPVPEIVEEQPAAKQATPAAAAGGKNPEADEAAEKVEEEKEPLFAKLKRKLTFPTYLDEQQKIYIAWLAFVSSAFLYNAYGVPLRSSFPYQTPENLPYWLVMDYITDVVYIMDMVVFKPRLTFVRDGMTIRDPLAMRRNYIYSNRFKMDLLSLMPLEVFYAVPQLRFNALLRLPRLLRLKNYQDFFASMDSVVSSPYGLRITRMLSYMIYLIHCNSCIYYSFSAWQGLGSNEWVYSGTGNAYIRCFYFMQKVPLPLIIEFGGKKD